MSRLYYSERGMRRALLLTGAKVTVFVEGLLDLSFYSVLFSACDICDSSSVIFRLAREINPTFGAGKRALIAQHQDLTSHNALVHRDAGGKHITVFLTDKDIDDIEGITISCPHLIYTEHYGIENYLYLNGALDQALCFGAGLDIYAAQSLQGNMVWAEVALNNWKDWVALCLLMRSMDPTFGPNYGAWRSEIHDSAYGALDAGKEDAFIQQLAARTGFPETVVRGNYANSKSQVAASLASGKANELFNGKWYLPFLAKDALRLAAGRQLLPSYTERLESALLSSLQFDLPWAGYLRNKITSVCLAA